MFYIGFSSTHETFSSFGDAILCSISRQKGIPILLIGQKEIMGDANSTLENSHG